MAEFLAAELQAIRLIASREPVPDLAEGLGALATPMNTVELASPTPHPVNRGQF